MPKKAALVAAVLATIGAFTLLAQTASKPAMSLLYAGLDGRAAGEVIAALERMDVSFEVRGDAIYVPTSRRDVARMSLAAEGLPQSGQAGYELLDKLSSFSTTSEMFDATYWRAKEGELARTILSTPGVSSARVHIGQQSGGPFARNRATPTGVVTVTMGRGELSQSQAQAIQFLVGSAVPGMSPAQVAVLDSIRGVVLSPGEDSADIVEENKLASREQKIESDIRSLLEARVGPGNVRVQVALDIDREREAISERVLDPEGRVITGREINEVTESAAGTGGSPVTVASNLPDGDVAGGGGESNSQRSETREVINYNMSEIRREREKLPGSIRRLTIAVLVNEIVEEGENGAAPTLRQPTELETLRDLVAQAAGFDESRGDTLTIQALPFKPLSTEGSIANANPVGSFFADNLMGLIQIAVLSIVTLILGLFVVKPVLAAQGGPAPAFDDAPPSLEMDEPLGALGELPQFDDFADEQDDDPVEALKGIAGDKTDEVADVLKNWLESERTGDPA